MSRSVLSRTGKSRIAGKMLAWAKAELERPIYPVRHVLDRIGETVNLLDPEEQLRFQAVMLARKYRKLHPFLAKLCSLSGRRALTPREAREVVHIVEKLGKACGQRE